MKNNSISTIDSDDNKTEILLKSSLKRKNKLDNEKNSTYRFFKYNVKRVIKRKYNECSKIIRK